MTITIGPSGTGADVAVPLTATYNVDSKTITGSAPATSSVIVTIDGLDQAPVTAAANNYWSFDAASLISGTHVYSAKIVSANGSLTINTAPQYVYATFFPPLV